MGKITYTQEDYLRCIYLLQERKGRAVKSVEVAESLGLSKSNISQRMNELQAKGWIVQERYHPIRLTDDGFGIAQNLTYKHRIIESFLVEVLGMDPDEVHEEANLMEHSCSQKVIEKMATFLTDTDYCPHGGKIKPDRKKKV